MRDGTGSHHTFITIDRMSQTVMAGDPYGRAIRDFYHDEQEEPLMERDGAEAVEHLSNRFTTLKLLLKKRVLNGLNYGSMGRCSIWVRA